MNVRAWGFTGASLLLFSACMVEIGDDPTEEEGGGATAGDGDSTSGEGGDGSSMDDDEVPEGTGILDPFGIEELYPSQAQGPSWNSKHWATGEVRSFTGVDPSDPTGWSTNRGSAPLSEIDGQGVLRLGGERPAFYLLPPPDKVEPFFKNVEFTGYFRRMADDGTSGSGFIVGIRTHADGHHGSPCLATTYYLRFRDTGIWLFNKELEHPQSQSEGGGRLFEDGGAIPVAKWIGMKFVAYNIQNDTAVKLEAYIDSTSNGEVGEEGVTWRKLGEIVDDGNWEAPVTEECGYPENTVITQGSGAVFLRNMEVSEVQYKMLSFREISVETE